MARLTNADVNRMSLGDALAAQDAITDWDRAHIASHKRMRSAGLGQARQRTGDAMVTGSILAPAKTVVKDEPKKQMPSKSSVLNSTAVPSPSALARTVNNANAQLAVALRPLHPLIDRVVQDPPYYKGFKKDLKVKPVDALIGLVSPIDNFFYDWVNNSLSVSSIKAGGVRRVGIPALNQLQVDFTMGFGAPANMDAVTAQYFKRLQAVTNITVLAVQDPPALAKGLVKTLVDAAKAGAEEARRAAEIATGFVKYAANAGIKFMPGMDKYFKGFSGIEQDAEGKLNQFLQSLVIEIKNQMPSLPIFNEIQRIITESTEMVQFMSDYLVWLYSSVGAQLGAYPVPFNYWVAAYRVDIDNGDTQMQRTITEMRNKLYALGGKGDAQGWNGPVYNRAFKTLIFDNINSDLDTISRNVSDLASKRQQGGRLAGYFSGPADSIKRGFEAGKQAASSTVQAAAGAASSVASAIPGVPIGDPRYSLINAAISYGPPSKLLSGGAFSDKFFGILRGAGVLDNVRGTVIDRVNGSLDWLKVPSQMRLNRNMAVPGLSGYRAMGGVPMDAYTFSGLGEPITLGTILGIGTLAVGVITAVTGMIATAISTAALLSKLVFDIISSFQSTKQSKMVPSIVAQPVSVSVAPGTDVAFQVVAKLVDAGAAPSISDIVKVGAEVSKAGSELSKDSGAGTKRTDRERTDRAPPPKKTAKEEEKTTSEETSTAEDTSSGTSTDSGNFETPQEMGTDQAASAPVEGIMGYIYRDLNRSSLRGYRAMGAVGDQELMTYQWFKDRAPIANATDATLTVGRVSSADTGAKYGVRVSLKADPTVYVDSDVATLTVTPAGADGKQDAGSDQKKDTMDKTPEKKSSILPIVLGAGAIAALPVAGPLAALALGAGAIATAMGKKKEAPAEKKPLSGYAGLYGYLGVTSMDRVNRITTAMNVPAKELTLTTDTKSQQSEKKEEKKEDKTALYVVGGLSVAGLILAAAYKKK